MQSVLIQKDVLESRNTPEQSTLHPGRTSVG